MRTRGSSPISWAVSRRISARSRSPAATGLRPAEGQKAVTDLPRDRPSGTVAGGGSRDGKEAAMPRASWKGFLRLSLVSCPVYLSPASTRTKSIRLHQVWQPTAMRGGRPEEVEDEEDVEPGRDAGRSPNETT